MEVLRPNKKFVRIVPNPLKTKKISTGLVAPIPHSTAVRFGGAAARPPRMHLVANSINILLRLTKKTTRMRRLKRRKKE